MNGRWETRSKFLLMCLLGWQRGVRRCVASNDTTKIATATPPFVVALDVGVICGWSKQQLTNVARVSLLHMYRCCTCLVCKKVRIVQGNASLIWWTFRWMRDQLLRTMGCDIQSCRNVTVSFQAPNSDRTIELHTAPWNVHSCQIVTLNSCSFWDHALLSEEQDASWRAGGKKGLLSILRSTSHWL